MLRCFYTAGTGMLVQRDRMEVLSNNLTNVDTAGYKADSLISSTFQDMMVERLNDPRVISATNIVGPLGVGTHIEEVHTSFVQGNIEETGRSCDMALEGDGFFAVSTPQGERYTRDGSFGVTNTGYLVTSEGLYVQGQNGRIYVGGDNFKVDEQGNVYVGDTLTDKLRIVSFTDNTGLRKDGSNLYERVSGGMQAAQGVKVVQGSLEGSNVDTAEDLTRMMATSKAYQLNQRVLGMVDESLQKAVNDVGRVG